MSFQPMLIAPFQTGLDIDLEPWIAPPDSFTDTTNIHVHHSFIEKRQGYEVFGQVIPNATPIAITNITNADPGVVTTGAAHGYMTGDFVFITGVTGMISINNKGFFIIVLSPTTFSIGIDTTLFTPYAGGGTVALVDILLDRIMGIFRFLQQDGTKQLLVFTTLRASIYNGVTNAFDQLDPMNIMSGSVYDYIWSVNWQSQDLDNRLYFTNGKAFDGASLDGIRYYDGTPGVTFNFAPTFTELTPMGTLPGARRFLYGGKLLFVLRARLIVLSTFEFDETTATTTSFQQRARWCQAQGPSNWDDTTAGGGGFVDCPTGDQIVSGRALSDQIIVFFTNSIWALVPLSNPAIPFRWIKLNDFRAADGKMASIGYDRDVRALGVRGITATDGVQTARIDNRIEDFTVNFINLDEFQKVYCQRSYETRRWWTLFPSTSQENPTNEENNKALIFDDESSAYTIYEINMNCLGYGNAGFDYSLDDFTEENNLNFRLNDFTDETLQSFFWQENQERFMGGNIFGTVFTMEVGGDDDLDIIYSQFKTAGWNPFQGEGREAQLSYIDFLIDTDLRTTASIEFFTDNSNDPYIQQEMDFLPNLDFIATIINVTQSNPAVVSAPEHGLSTGDTIFIYNVEGMDEINGGPYIITVINENSFSLDGVDSTLFDPYDIRGQVFWREFYKTKTWKRVYGGAIGYLHQIQVTSIGANKSFRFHAFKPYFKPRGRRTIN